MATVKQLIELLKQFPEDMQVIMENTDIDSIDSTYFHLTGEAEIKKISDTGRVLYGYTEGDETKTYKVNKGYQKNWEEIIEEKQSYPKGCYEVLYLY